MDQALVGNSRPDVPQNAVTNRPYSGCNVVLLWLAREQGWPTPRFLTFRLIASWIELLKADKKAFFAACNRASRAADYLRGLALAEPAANAA